MKQVSDNNHICNIYALHGFTGCGLDFSPLKVSIMSYLDGLGADINWFCPSLPGHGESSNVDCSILGQYDFLNQYIQSNAKQEKVSHLHSLREPKNILIAYSMGSRLGLYHASQQADFWDAIVLIGVNPGIQSETERALRRESDKKLADKIGKNGLPWFLDYWKHLPLISTQSMASKDFKQAMQERKNSLDVQGLQNSLIHFGQGVFPDLWDAVPTIQVPVLLINGSLDIKYCEISQRFSKIYTKAQCEVIKNCGHAPHIESPHSTAKTIVTFFKKQLF